MTAQDFQNFVDGAYHLLTAPFVLFLVAIAVGAIAIMAVKKQ